MGEGEGADHECHARGCRAIVSPRRLMCLAHWRSVPLPLQKRVWASYVSGQEIRKDPSLAYLEAAEEAIAAVEEARALQSEKRAQSFDGCVLLWAKDGTVVEKLFEREKTDHEGESKEAAGGESEQASRPGPKA